MRSWRRLRRPLTRLALATLLILAASCATSQRVPDERYTALALPADFEARCGVTVDKEAGPQLRRGYFALHSGTIATLDLDLFAVPLPMDFEARCGIALDRELGPQKRSGYSAVSGSHLKDAMRK